MYNDILLPTDGGLGVERALEHALELARRYDATLHVLYVVDTRDYNTLPESKWLTVEDDLVEAGEDAVGLVRDRATEAGVEVTTTVGRGVPHQEILSYAADNGVDLVVMGTHSRTGLNRFLLGSVTEKVVRSADVPVMVVRLAESDD